MTYHLILGDRAYSSWSLRGWLLFEKFNLPFKQRFVDFDSQDVGDQMAELAPSRTVPTMVTPDGAVVWDSLAIAEELASRHPDAGIWPADPSARAMARNLAAEMHSGYGALRSTCPMNLRCAYTSFAPPDAVKADVTRIEQVWTHALEKFGGPWLCGDYSAADAFFAPVAARFAGYDLTVSGAAKTYLDRQLADPAFRRWRAMSLVKGPDLPWYARDYDQGTWPGPAPLLAKRSDAGPPENAQCPYSGDPVTHFMELDGRVFGFCNEFCRNKTVPDPAAWPAFMAIYQS
jgi:glutathione S-transferase